MNGKILVTGGFGNIGSWISKEFQDAGYKVVVGSSRGIAPQGLDGVRCLKFDLMEPDSVLNALHRESFETVVHAGSLNDVFLDGYFWKAYRTNVEGTSSLLKALNKECLKKFLYFSTFHVYGLSEGVITEETPCNPASDYATSHLAAEFIVRQHAAVSGFSATILRLSNSYGRPRFAESAKWHLIFNDLVSTAAKEGKIYIKTDPLQRRDFVWMGDVARATRLIANRHSRLAETYNLSFGKSLTLEEFAMEIAAGYRDAYGKDLELNIPSARTGCHRQLLFDSNKLWNTIACNPENRVRAEAKLAFESMGTWIK